ncbi:TPA: chromosomal replication initiator protein DnaA [Candidatus Gastranaerophilales bacterium HUM_9]|mgnify:FL=1|nr:MAG TPA: chromosomal replication initiator protein DnaA [Candidatus Gastranaerophilales bacterium HUM_9]HBX34344.1 chromosomal replication initiator protein DnaA [Cyanobacteria bacterium UBA11440]
MDSLEIKQIWEDTKSYLQGKLNEAEYPWLNSFYPTGYTDGTFTVITDMQLAITIIRKNCLGDIKSALKHVTGHDVEFQIILDKESTKKLKAERKKLEQKFKKINTEEKTDNPMLQMTQMQSNVNLNLKYKFENFVVGENNKNACAIAKIVAKNPAERYNPLFIYGGSGLGKTHLMQAIGHYAIFNLPRKKVKYIKTQDYVNQYIESTRGKDSREMMAKFRQRFRNVDILLIDDIQFIESKKQSMEELFYTFETLQQLNKQIVITSDRLPKDIPTLPDRLRTRFEMGIVVDIQPPSFETRMEILEKWTKDTLIDIPLDALNFIAQNFINNVRELEGAFNKVTAYSDIEGKPITLEFVKDVLKSETLSKKITINNIAQTVAEIYNITVDDLKSPARSHNISEPRRYVVYLAREMTQLSYQEIADYLNKKHTTMLYSYEKMVEDTDRNIKLKETMRELKQAIKCNAV